MKLTHRFVMLMNPQEKTEFARVANLVGMSVASWIRGTMRKEAVKICRNMKVKGPVWDVEGMAEETAPIYQLTPEDLPELDRAMEDDWAARRRRENGKI